MSRRAAFYAPLKHPDDPVPSGDRTVARLYRDLLGRAGYAVDVVSALRAYDGGGDAARQAAIVAAAEAERARIAALWRDAPETRPALWLTYHLYYKAPDLIGPDLCAAFSIPYVVVEPSHAPKRARGRWAEFHAAAERAIAAADLAVVVTERDAACVRPLRAGRETALIRPFIDVAGWRAPERRGDGACRMIAVAMMRPGDKSASYALLAQALALVGDADWTLTLVGDGPARGDIEALFAPFAGRVRFAGAADGEGLQDLLAAHDLFVWPAVNEAYGVAPMEAQAAGLPVVAGREGGVAEVVRDGETGILAPPRDPSAFADALARLIAEPERRRAMGAAARAFIAGERSLEAATARLAPILGALGRRCAS